MKNLSEIRKDIGFSQVDFAALLGVSIASYRRWEKGDHTPSPLAKERITHIIEEIQKGNLEKLMAENSKKVQVVHDLNKSRQFSFNGENHIVQYMPYVYNGPADQLDFFNKLISMQEKKQCRQSWPEYSRRLSIVESADGCVTEQYMIERPGECTKSWSADSGSHGWHRYVGRFPAQLVRAIINRFDLNENDLLLDPFCGSGTTIVEARLLGVPAIGIEISPLSAMISRVKSGFPPDTTELLQHIKLLEKFYTEEYARFLGGREINAYSHENILGRVGNEIAPFSNYEKWFSKEALLGTSIVVQYIMGIKKNKPIAEAIATALSSKMRSIGNVDVDVVRAEYRKTPRENVDVLKLVVAQLRKMVKSTNSMLTSHQQTLRGNDTVSIMEGDCLTANLKANSISAIITSPPYGVESLSYLRTHLLSFRSLEPLLGVDPYNFGEAVIGSEYLSNQKINVDELHVVKTSATCKAFFTELLKNAELPKTKTRIAMMMKFFEDMDVLVDHFNTWLQPKGQVAFVIGNKKIEDDIVPTDQIMTEIFASHGFLCTDSIAHKLKTNNSNSQVPWQDRIIENEFVIFYEKK